MNSDEDDKILRAHDSRNSRLKRESKALGKDEAKGAGGSWYIV